MHSDINSIYSRKAPAFLEKHSAHIAKIWRRNLNFHSTSLADKNLRQQKNSYQIKGAISNNDPIHPVFSSPTTSDILINKIILPSNAFGKFKGIIPTAFAVIIRTGRAAQ